MFSAKKKRVLFNKKYVCFFFFFFVGKKMPSKRLEEKRKCPPVLRNEWTRVKKTRKKSHIPTTTTTPGQGGGCFDATLKKRTDRRNRRHDFPELKFVQDGGFTGGIETNLRAFFRVDERRISSVSTVKNSAQPTDSRIHSTRSKSHHARPRDEARRPMFHRIGSPRIRKQSPPLFFSSGRCPLRPPLLQARNSKSNPLPLHHRQIIKNAVRFDDEY